MQDLRRVAGVTFAIRREFGGTAVEATLTPDGRLSVVFQDDRRSSLDTMARLSFADSMASFVVGWFEEKKRLSGMSLRLTHTSRTARTRQVTTSLYVIFVPEYEPDGSVHLFRVDPTSEAGPTKVTRAHLLKKSGASLPVEQGARGRRKELSGLAFVVRVADGPIDGRTRLAPA